MDTERRRTGLISWGCGRRGHSVDRRCSHGRLVRANESGVMRSAAWTPKGDFGSTRSVHASRATWLSAPRSSSDRAVSVFASSSETGDLVLDVRWEPHHDGRAMWPQAEGGCGALACRPTVLGRLGGRWHDHEPSSLGELLALRVCLFRADQHEDHPVRGMVVRGPPSDSLPHRPGCTGLDSGRPVLGAPLPHDILNRQLGLDDSREMDTAVAGTPRAARVSSRWSWKAFVPTRCGADPAHLTLPVRSIRYSTASSGMVGSSA
jgi:hypothetical protein